MKNSLQSSAVALGVGALICIAERELQTTFLTTFLRQNLLTMLVTLLAINAATLSVVLTKIRDLLDKLNTSSEAFAETKLEMQRSLNEQLALIVVGAALLLIESSPRFPVLPAAAFLLRSALCGCFVFALMILRDTIRGVFVLLDFPKKP